MALLVGAAVASPAIRGDHGIDDGNDYDPVKEPLKYVQAVVFCGPDTQDDDPVPDCPQEDPENCHESPFCGPESGNGTSVTVGYVGDIAWCNAHATNGEWKDRVTEVFEATESAVEDKNSVDLRFAWAMCTTTPGPYHHSEGNYGHTHDGETHPYPFNKVPDDHNIQECQEPKNDNHDTSYFNAEQGYYDSNGDWQSASGDPGVHDYDGFVGAFAYRYDAEQLHGLSPHADMVQLLHDENFNGGDFVSNQYGQACLPTNADGKEGSAVREPSLDNAQDATDIGPIHEMGHTFNAYHCDSSSTNDPGNTFTIMASHDDNRCPKNTNFHHVNAFSDDTADAIQSWAKQNYG